MSNQIRNRTQQESKPELTRGPTPGSSSIDQARELGQRLYDAADAVLDQALSGNSEAFLASNRQEGGQ